MSSGEQERRPTNPDHDPTRYHQAARFAGERSAGHAYEQIQETIYNAPQTNLSGFRLNVDQDWYVAVLGEQPPQELHHELRRILATGEPTTLPDEVLDVLFQRRTRQRRLGDWVEGHYRPGRRLT